MTTLEIKSDWNITKSLLKRKWAKLTEDDLQYAVDRYDELLARIQKRTGETREAVEKAMMESASCNSAFHHTQKIKGQMSLLIEHLREDIGKIKEPKVQALFETSAEVLTGLIKALDDCENKTEEAWRAEPMSSHPHDLAQKASRQ